MSDQFWRPDKRTEAAIRRGNKLHKNYQQRIVQERSQRLRELKAVREYLDSKK